MRYLPQTPQEIKLLCETLKVSRPDDLFQVIPEAFRLRELLDLPKPLSESELLAQLKRISKKNKTVAQQTSFLGAGAYAHYIPSAVAALTSRGEFATSYTPYQPELSQGTLQAIFEFQTMTASLLGMEVSNASNYDGSTSLAEAILMARRIKKHGLVVLAKSIHPEYRAVVKTLLHNLEIQLIELDWTSAGACDLRQLKSLLAEQSVAALCVQSPNFFGVIEDLEPIAELVHQNQALLISVTTDPIALGVLKAPGDCGVDIAVGEGQSLGLPLQTGGPYLGLFATRKEFVRQMPGRLVGETVDSHGQRGFALTLNTREQHIRREKATSNICTNQSLCALAASIYLSLLGPQGLKELALLNLSKAEYAKQQLLKIPRVKLLFQTATFHEFVIQLPRDSEPILKKLEEHGILAGVPLECFYPELQDCLLICVTETISKQQIDDFVQKLFELLA